MYVSQLTRWPLRVSPFFSSTSMGWPCAAVSRPSGNYDGRISIGLIGSGKVGTDHHDRGALPI